MPHRDDDPFLLNLHLEAGDLEKLFEPFDPYEDEAVEPKYPERPEDAGEAHDPIDWRYVETVRDSFLGDIVNKYFRAEIYGAEKIPKEGPLIVAPNHSGNAFPHDGMVMDALLWHQQGYDRLAKFRSVYSPKLAAVWWMRLYGIDNWWRRGGGVDMTFVNFDRLLARKDKVIYYPEGVPGIGKGFQRRYQLQYFHSSFVVLAAKHHAPIYPVSIVNAEWVNPTSITFGWLDKLADRILGIPFFPVPIIFLALVFPFIFYFAFPCKMVILVRDPVDVRKLLEEAGADPDQPSREQVKAVAEQIRQYAQRKLDEGVAEHGQKPYHMKSFFRAMWGIRGRIWRTLSLGWPFTFVRHARDLERKPSKNFVQSIWRDWDIVLYYVPFGWFLIALLRKLRKPPYGYRGLTRKERIRREGSYRWSLEKHPLPSKAQTIAQD